MLPFMPMLIGAALGGGISAARGGNPLTGALLGAAGGAFGGATGLLGSTTGATTAGTVGSAIVPAANVASAGGVEALKQGVFAGGGNLAGMTTGIGAVPAAAPAGFFGNTMAGIGSDISAFQKFAQQNPMFTNQVGGLAKQALFPEQQPMAQGPGIIRGQQMAQQQPQYNPYAAPNISLI